VVGLTHDRKPIHRAAEKKVLLLHYSSYSEFEKSAQRGCHVCLLFWNQIPDGERHELRKARLNSYIQIQQPSVQIDSAHMYEIGLAFQKQPTSDGVRRVSYMLTLHMLEVEAEGTCSIRYHDASNLIQA